jgi:hypothetical protein
VGKPVSSLLGPGLITRQIEVRPQDVLLVRAHLEASEGLGALFAERGGDLTLAAPECLEAQLDAFIDDLAKEMPISRR